jgi:hypothetical protein
VKEVEGIMICLAEARGREVVRRRAVKGLRRGFIVVDFLEFEDVEITERSERLAQSSLLIVEDLWTSNKKMTSRPMPGLKAPAIQAEGLFED